MRSHLSYHLRRPTSCRRLPRHITRWTVWAINTLAQRALRDPAAFARLFRRFHGWLRHQAHGYHLPGITPDDLYQEASLAFWIAVQSYQPRYHLAFSTWATHVVRRRLASTVRMALRTKHRPLNTATSLSAPMHPHGDRILSDHLIDPQGNPSDIWETRELWTELIQHAAQILSDHEWEILWGRLAGYSYPALAAQYHTTPKHIDNTLQRAKRKLRRAWASSPSDDRMG
ncbi:sigma-70 family RNA polymerase sigma factor [Sulfobacillus thermosulfidooxidans]|uniref:sigma-70 family RNA polymerase sigma factor n=1 Tax=Sulfobacillus thermosulfidooxidans TaxID=28034 RepID=UPI0002FB9EB2|nr:sigma-70 family RNA polymerase sigma factor [Sulfobacillus thermosulfidooxidans]